MKVKAEGFNCEIPDEDDDLNFFRPQETQIFEGTEESIEGELAAFGSRFKWYRVTVQET